MRWSFYALRLVTVLGACASSARADFDIVPFGADWRYLNPQGIGQSPAVTNPSFDTSWFKSGYSDTSPLAWQGPSPSPFAYGTIDAFEPIGPATDLVDPGVLDRYTTYFRREFVTTEPWENLFVDLLADDGAVVYLDGDKVLSSNCCVNRSQVYRRDGFDTFASGNGPEDGFRTIPLEPFGGPPLLEPGPHVVAVSVHQRSTTSDDLGFGLRLFSREEPDHFYVDKGDSWRLFRGHQEPSPGLEWSTLGFDDSEWDADEAGFGYDVNASSQEGLLSLVNTELNGMRDDGVNQTPYSSLYIRKPFQVADPDGLRSLVLAIDYDDSFIAYINGTEVARSDHGAPGTPEPFNGLGTRHESSNGKPAPGLGGFPVVPERFNIDPKDFPGLLQSSDNVLAIQGLNSQLSSSDFLLGQITLGAVTEHVSLQAGDANQDLKFGQHDLVKVAAANKYLTGKPATWGEGDWNGAPGGRPGTPPAGDGVFDQTDIQTALGAGTYASGPYGFLRAAGEKDDGQSSIIYDSRTGEVAVDVATGRELTSIEIDSAAGIFTGDPASNVDGLFDNHTPDNLFKATFGESFGSFSFGNVAQPGLSEAFMLEDLTVLGTLNGDGLGALRDVDLVYFPVPEPSSIALLAVGIAALLRTQRQQRPAAVCRRRGSGIAALTLDGNSS